MIKSSALALCLLAISAYAEEPKTSFDVTIDKLNFVRPIKGVGKAGTLVFKSASVLNNGIVLNVNNVNNYFDSQIFVRPTFLGFTTQFGNFGFGIEESNMINTVKQTDLTNAKFIMDDNQLALSGESMNFVNVDSSVRLKGFRLYCQNNTLAVKETGAIQTDILSSCFSFMTLNGTYQPGNELAELEYEGIDGADKTFIKAKVRSFDIRPNEILANLPTATTVSNDSYTINASDVVLSCAKDADLVGLDFEKIKKPCMNKMRLNPLKANLIDKKENSQFNLDVKNIVVQDKVLYVTLNNAVMSDPKSSTHITNTLLNCRKNADSDLLELTHVLRDCLEYGRASIAEVRSTGPDDKKDSSNKNIAISVENGAIIIQADIKFLGFTSRVSIYGRASLDEQKRHLILNVTDTKLPLGITSVKLLMHFLKKDLISKDITFSNNVITIAL